MQKRQVRNQPHILGRGSKGIFLGKGQRAYGKLLTLGPYYPYRKMTAAKMVFVRFGAKAKQIILGTAAPILGPLGYTPEKRTTSLSTCGSFSLRNSTQNAIT